MVESKSQKLFSFVQSNIENCKTTEGKNSLIEKYNAEITDEKEKITQGHFGKTLRNYIKKEKLNYDDFGLKSEKNSQSGGSGDALETTLEDGSVPKPAKDINPKIITQKQIQENIRKNALNLDDAVDGKIKIKYTVKMVASFWVGFYRLFQMVIPELEDFDDEEKNDLGESCLPLFQKYLQYGFMEFVAPLMTVGGIFASKIKKARATKDKQHKLELEQIEKAKDAKEELDPTERH